MPDFERIRGSVQGLARAGARAAAACALLGLSLAGTAGAQGVKLAGGASVERGTVFTVTLTVISNTALGHPSMESLDFRIGYDPAVLEYVSAAPGSAFDAAGDPPLALENDTGSELRVGAAATQAFDLPDGARLYRITFRALSGSAARSATLDLTLLAIDERAAPGVVPGTDPADLELAIRPAAQEAAQLLLPALQLLLLSE